ncbi:YdeI/OmpD-associated family protein [Chondrinema litorale]|uniref:YdeI/OmpD-associated family protein n=1 Tax=Chondrinema litorale TaxID=2994555 RepID=UPI002543F871|nr:DUF1801 domain-containing protein [Chondrinema litorale]UZR96101.1 DUF1801 domain-containing protein [Chondrinema litorale]
MSPKVDSYFAVGCGRCLLGGTPDCKVHNWQEEMEHLRTIILSCALTEEVKWGVPCYTFQSKNVLILSAFKEYCSINFFKGALLKDPKSILQKPGENTQAARLIKFTKVQQVIDLEETIKTYILEAIEIEKAGLTVDFKKKNEIEYPEELQDKLNEDTELKKAFEALTPGRQRGYIIYFSQPTQAKTRVSRIEKCAVKIFEGKGLQDR